MPGLRPSARAFAYALVAAAGIGAVLWSAQDRTGRALDALEADAERAVQTIGAVTAAAHDKVGLLRTQAQSTLRSDSGLVDPAVAAALVPLQDRPEIRVLRLASTSSRAAGRSDGAYFSLHGPTPASDSPVSAEIRMALELQDLLVGAQVGTEGAAWVYYLSAGAFQLVAPASSPGSLVIDPRRTKRDVVKLASRESNPTRQAFWTDPYLDPFGKGLVCTVAAPVDDARGGYRGLVGMDFTLERLAAFLQLQRTRGVRPMLLGPAGQVLADTSVVLSADERTLMPGDVAPTDAAVPVWRQLADLPAGPHRDIGGYSVRVWDVPAVPWRYVLTTDLGALRRDTLRQMAPEFAGLALLALVLWAFEHRRRGLLSLTRQQMLVDVLANAPAPIAVLRRHDARVLQMNPALLDLFGSSAQAPEDQHAAVRAQLAALVPQLAERPLALAGVVGPHELHQRFERPDGSPFWALVRAAPERHAGEAAWLCSLTDVTALQQTREHLATLAVTDALTEVLNRRGLGEQLEIQLQRAQQHGQPLSLLLIDVDQFKRINDEHGHEVGDRALATLAAACRHALRPSDLLGRWGGEEFVALLPGADPTAAQEVAERLRERVALLEVPLGGPSLRLTISLGVATAGPDMSAAGLLAAADRALYEAKRAGRNRVVMA